MSKLRRCLTCDTEFYTEKGKYCSKDCRPKIEKICIICQTPFSAVRKNGEVCSKECRQEQDRIKRDERLKDDNSMLTCLECNMKVGKSLTWHLNKLHSMSVLEYQNKHKVGIENTTAQITRQILSEQNSGDKNVWYNHQGKLSPFSKNNDRYDEDERLDNQKRAIQNRIDNGNSTTSLEYYLKKTKGNIVRAKLLLKDRQSTFSLEKCVEKYGEEEGRKVWQQRQNKWQETLNSKSDEEIERINQSKMWQSGMMSKIATQLFDNLDIEGARYGKKTEDNLGEKMITLPDKKRAMIDYFYNGKIIEFFGDYWHANPVKFNETNHIQRRSKRMLSSVKDIWERDKERISQLEELGYEVMIVWENDYKKEPERIIQQCKDFLAT